jgi:hypothetical protein
LNRSFKTCSLVFEFKLGRSQFRNLDAQSVHRLLHRQSLSQLLSNSADFAPKRNVIDFNPAQVVRPGLRLIPPHQAASGIANDLVRHPDPRRVGDPGVRRASRVFGNP